MKKKLKEICTQIRGVSYKPSDVRDEFSGIPILRANNIQDTGIVFDELVYVDSSKVHSEQYLLTDDIVICASSGSKNLVGKAATYKSDLSASFGAFCKVVRINNSDDLCKAYIQQYFQSKIYRNAISESSAGANINNIKTEDIEALEIPLPSKEAQQKIAAELDTIQSAINNKKQQLSLLDEAVKSEFVEMFGEGSCKQIPFSEYAEIIDGDRGKNYPKSEDFSDDDYCLFLSAKNVTKNGFLFENNQFISKEKDEILRKGKLNRGDIVITTRGTIGNIAYFDDSIPYENIRINSGMVIIRNKDLEFNQRFFLEAFRNKIDEIIATQVTGAAQPQLPIHIMSKITLPYPDLPLQNKFAAFVQQIDKSKFVVKQQIADLQELLDSKMQEYFS